MQICFGKTGAPPPRPLNLPPADINVHTQYRVLYYILKRKGQDTGCTGLYTLYRLVMYFNLF